jgi:hypothetical protein
VLSVEALQDQVSSGYVKHASEPVRGLRNSSIALRLQQK